MALKRLFGLIKPLALVCLVVGPWLVLFTVIMVEGPTPDRYDFLPYDLRVLPGDVGDGDRGRVSPPGITFANQSQQIVNSPIKLKRIDLGGAGDYVVDYDRNNWVVLGYAEGTMHPGILLSTFESGKIAYVSNQLYELQNLLTNILAWFSMGKSRMQLAMMSDVPNVPDVPTFDKWQNGLQQVSGVLKRFNLPEPELREIHAFDLNPETLQDFDILILMTGWGDGYYSGSSRWYDSQRGAAIKEFVRGGGALLLPEAGFRNRIVPSFYVLLEMFSFGTTCLSMIAPSVTFAIAITAAKRELPGLLQGKDWIVLVSCFITAANLWIIAAALVYSFQVDTATFFISAALLLDILPWGFFLATVAYRMIHRLGEASLDARDTR